MRSLSRHRKFQCFNFQNSASALDTDQQNEFQLMTKRGFSGAFYYASIQSHSIYIVIGVQIFEQLQWIYVLAGILLPV